MKRRKAVSVLLVMAMAASMLTGCGGEIPIPQEQMAQHPQREAHQGKTQMIHPA